MCALRRFILNDRRDQDGKRDNLIRIAECPDIDDDDLLIMCVLISFVRIVKTCRNEERVNSISGVEMFLITTFSVQKRTLSTSLGIFSVT